MSDTNLAPKRRGRKPKSTEGPKKRGRKPKQITSSEGVAPQLPITSVISKPILIKLKLTREDTKRLDQQLTTFYRKEYTPVVNVPTPFDQSGTNAFMQLRKIETTQPVAEQKEATTDAFSMCHDRSKLVSLPEIFQKGVWPDKTNIKCWWCTLSFNTVPCFLPTRLKWQGDKKCYQVLGCFCSFNCAMAYNLYALEQDQYEKMHKSTLIHSVYTHIHDEKNDQLDILPAPPKEKMIAYGGTWTVDEYRERLTKCTTQSSKLCYPPIVGINFQLETIAPSKQYTGGHQYKLARSKPPPNRRNKLTKRFVSVIN